MQSACEGIGLERIVESLSYDYQNRKPCLRVFREELWQWHPNKKPVQLET